LNLNITHHNLNENASVSLLAFTNTGAVKSFIVLLPKKELPPAAPVLVVVPPTPARGYVLIDGRSVAVPDGDTVELVGETVDLSNATLSGLRILRVRAKNIISNTFTTIEADNIDFGSTSI
jgi:hypothetical protein